MKLLITLSSFFLSSFLFSQDSIPNYLFFLHNRFLENHSLKEKHDEYGRAEYKEILDRFTSLGFTVISEKREPETDVMKYAEKVLAQIDSLKKLNVPSEKITVVGTSKGGYIAQYVSSLAKDSTLSFVFIGGFHEADLSEMSSIRWYGRICSIHESSDDLATSAIKKLEDNQGLILDFYELKLNTGKKHGFLYKALDEWIVPAANWGKHTLIQDSISPELKAQSDLLKLTGIWTYDRKGPHADMVIQGNSWYPVDMEDVYYYQLQRKEKEWVLHSNLGDRKVRFQWVNADEVLFFWEGQKAPMTYYRWKN